MKFFWKYKLDHVIFWSITIAYYAYIKSSLLLKAGFHQYLLDVLVRNFMLACICYFNIYILFPRYFKRGRYAWYVSALLACLLLYTFVKNGHDRWVLGGLAGSAASQNLFSNSYFNFSNALFYLAFLLALELSKKWYQQQQLLQQMQVEKLQTELRYLKAQMNPHFLFNSINTIYFQIDRKNREARESVEKFSELLRYQLYECNEDRIPIEKEIEYLRSYVDLQRLRKHANYCIRFHAGDEVQQFCIAPLLLISFVENAFKHVSTYTDRINTIQVLLERQNGDFMFRVANSKDNDRLPPNDKGIGLKNVRRRLELLYANKYDLVVKNEETLFSVQLKLRLP
ncbi:MAG: histidine kinase [Williamsia sp.]|nr:histidine kinase [Williamsia sp.]